MTLPSTIAARLGALLGLLALVPAFAGAGRLRSVPAARPETGGPEREPKTGAAGAWAVLIAAP